MSIRLVFVAACMLLSAPSLALADRAGDSALEARVKALEQRVAELEARLAAKPASTPVAPAGSVVPHEPAQPAAPAARQLRNDPAKWAQIRQGMGWSQVRDLLGAAGKKTTGVFGDVWYYPDESGGRIVFDRDGRVAEFNAPPAR